MEKSGPYVDRKINHYPATAQIQHLPDSYPAEVEHPSVLSKPDGERHWDRDGLRMTNQWPPHQYTEGQVGLATRSQYHGQMPHPNTGLEKEIEQDMEIGYEEKPSLLTLETLEKKFCDEIMRLAKEESDADDAENARHKEKKMEISNQYQEKLSALRDLQAKQREEFLLKETKERLNQYHRKQQEVPNNYPTDRGSLDPRGYGPHHYPTDTGVINPRHYPHHHPTDTGALNPLDYGHYPTDTSAADPRGYGGPAITEAPHRGYTPGPYEPYRQRSPHHHQVQRKQQEAERKVPIPQGRAYNNTRARNL